MDKERTTVNDFAARWFDDYAPIRLCESSLRRYRTLYEGILREKIGGRILWNLEVEEVQGAVTEIYSERGYRRDSASMSMIQDLLRDLLEDAFFYEKLSRYDLSRGIRVHRRVSNPQEPLREEEIRALLQMEERPYLENVIFLMMTACKVGQMTGLLRRDVDFERGVIMVAGREIYYPRILEEWIGWRKGQEADSLFFAEADGRPFRVHTFRRALRNIMDDIGRPDCSTEGLRKTAVAVSRLYSGTGAEEAVMMSQYGKYLGRGR